MQSNEKYTFLLLYKAETVLRKVSVRAQWRSVNGCWEVFLQSRCICSCFNYTMFFFFVCFSFSFLNSTSVLTYNLKKLNPIHMHTLDTSESGWSRTLLPLLLCFSRIQLLTQIWSGCSVTTYGTFKNTQGSQDAFGIFKQQCCSSESLGTVEAKLLGSCMAF